MGKSYGTVYETGANIQMRWLWDESLIALALTTLSFAAFSVLLLVREDS
jgi:hypothetical protein